MLGAPAIMPVQSNINTQQHRGNPSWLVLLQQEARPYLSADTGSPAARTASTPIFHLSAESSGAPFMVSKRAQACTSGEHPHISLDCRWDAASHGICLSGTSPWRTNDCLFSVQICTMDCLTAVCCQKPCWISMQETGQVLKAVDCS